MADDRNTSDRGKTENNQSTTVVYNTEKDFYKGIGGELRMKAEGLFKKAKEKGISIEEIDIITLHKSSAELPGVGMLELPTFFVKVKGKHAASGQVIVDGKQMDYFNRYQKYIADKIEDKNLVKDERGRVTREYGRKKVKDTVELTLTEWERFEVAKDILEDKEFGLEKTITGACDRVIRKLMGENDWLYPDEARLLDEEFENVQNRIAGEQEDKRAQIISPAKRATERQVNYFKIKVKNFGLDPEDTRTIKEILRQSGIQGADLKELTTGDMSKIIDNIGDIVPKVKETLGSNPLQ